MDAVHAGLALALALVAVVGVRAEVAEPLRVSGTSMSPTIDAGDVVLLDKRAACCQRGDVVALTSPADGALVVKRVAGTGGDVVAIEDGVLVVDGRPVEEPYLDPATVDGLWYGPVTVPSGAVLVLGDGRAASIDSRHFGPAPESSVRGRVLLDLRLPTWSAP